MAVVEDPLQGNQCYGSHMMSTDKVVAVVAVVVVVVVVVVVLVQWLSDNTEHAFTNPVVVALYKLVIC